MSLLILFIDTSDVEQIALQLSRESKQRHRNAGDGPIATGMLFIFCSERPPAADITDEVCKFSKEPSHVM